MRQSHALAIVSASVPWCFVAVFAGELHAEGLLPLSMMLAAVGSVISGAIGYIVGGYAEDGE